MTTLKQLTDQVVEDKKVQKALTSYVEGGRDLLCVTIWGPFHKPKVLSLILGVINI